MKTVQPLSRLSVSDAGYDQIQATIAAYHVCRTCEGYFTEENPCVMLNCCLRCFQQKRKYKHFRYLGPEMMSAFQLGVFRFLDERTGSVYLSSSQTDAPWYNAYFTLRHWGYEPPKEYLLPTGETVCLCTLRCEIVGDVRTRLPLVVRYVSGESTYAFVLPPTQRSSEVEEGL